MKIVLKWLEVLSHCFSGVKKLLKFDNVHCPISPIPYPLVQKIPDLLRCLITAIISSGTVKEDIVKDSRSKVGPGVIPLHGWGVVKAHGRERDLESSIVLGSNFHTLYYD